jgi:hypothetical protein
VQVRPGKFHARLNQPALKFSSNGFGISNGSGVRFSFDGRSGKRARRFADIPLNRIEAVTADANAITAGTAKLFNQGMLVGQHGLKRIRLLRRRLPARRTPVLSLSPPIARRRERTATGVESVGASYVYYDQAGKQYY